MRGRRGWLLSDEQVTGDAQCASLHGVPGPEFRSSMDALLDRVHPDDREAVRSVLGGAISSGESFSVTFRVRTPDSWRWLQLRGRAIGTGGELRLAGVVFDDSSVRSEEERLRAASIYSRSLIEASVDPLVTIGTDGRIMDVNEATETATGRSRSELVGSDFSDYFTEPDRARDGYRQVFTTGKIVDYPLTLQHVSGQVRDVLYNGSTFRDEAGRVAGVFAAARDVTEIRRAQAELEETNREVMLLSQTSDLLQSCHSIEEALPIIRASMQELFPGSHGRAFMLDATTNQLEESVAWGALAEKGSTISAPECWALRRNTIHDVHLGNRMNPPCRALPDEQRPYLCVPLLAQGQAMGIMHVIVDAPPHEKGRFVQLARAAADSISLAVANIRLRENLQALSTRDPLTGLYNRRFLEDALARELSRAGRARNTGVVAMLDIDHFKTFNDTYGHEAGDAVLLAVAERLRGFRATDLPCRYGGEEFLLVLTDLTVEQARTRLEQLRADISSAAAFHQGRALPGITVSIGMARFPQRSADAAEVIRRADEALYRAKTNGRDRLEVAEAPAES